MNGASKSPIEMPIGDLSKPQASGLKAEVGKSPKKKARNYRTTRGAF
jgi:hypothetical protein